MNRKFWKWTTSDEQNGRSPNERVLEINGTIAEESWFDDDLTPEMFRKELFSGDGDVVIWINSPGGDCVAASRIYAMLMDYKGNITVKVDGVAASAASVIAMAGTRVLMAPTALLMIHNPATGAYGDRADMVKVIEMLDEFKESIINAYELKTGLSRLKIAHLMDQETWMNAGKAIELGFADAILEDEKKHPTEPFSFSAKAAECSVVNKLLAKVGVRDLEKATVPEPEKIEEEPASEPIAAETGRNVDELMERLNLIKH